MCRNPRRKARARRCRTQQRRRAGGIEFRLLPALQIDERIVDERRLEFGPAVHHLEARAAPARQSRHGAVDGAKQVGRPPRQVVVEAEARDIVVIIVEIEECLDRHALRTERGGESGEFRRGAVETIKAQHMERRRCARDRGGDGVEPRAPVFGVEKRRVERGIGAARGAEQHMRSELPRRLALAHDERRERTAAARGGIDARLVAVGPRGGEHGRVPRDAVEEILGARRIEESRNRFRQRRRSSHRFRRRWRRRSPRWGATPPPPILPPGPSPFRLVPAKDVYSYIRTPNGAPDPE